MNPDSLKPSFSRDLRPMFMGGCTGCHGCEVGRFNPNTYKGLLGMVIPGETQRSTFVQLMSEGHHAPPLKADEIKVVIA